MSKSWKEYELEFERRIAFTEKQLDKMADNEKVDRELFKLAHFKDTARKMNEMFDSLEKNMSKEDISIEKLKIACGTCTVNQATFARMYEEGYLTLMRKYKVINGYKYNAIIDFINYDFEAGFNSLIQCFKPYMLSIARNAKQLTPTESRVAREVNFEGKPEHE